MNNFRNTPNVANIPNNAFKKCNTHEWYTPPSNSVRQIKEYLEKFVDVFKTERQYANINKVSVYRPTKRRDNLIVILKEQTGQERISVADELSIPINSDLYYNDSKLSSILYKICLVMISEYEPIITVTDIPKKPYIHITVTSAKPEDNTLRINLAKILPDTLVGANTELVQDYLNQLESGNITLKSYIERNGRFTEQLKWLLGFKEFVIKKEFDDDSPVELDIDFITDENRHRFYYNHCDPPLSFKNGQSYVDIDNDDIYPVPVPDGLKQYDLLYFIGDDKQTLDDIKNLSIAIIRTDENIWIRYKDDEYFELQYK